MTSVWSESPMLVVSDLDGTLSEIAPRPHLATWVEGAPDVLKRLVALPNVTAAIVTGRWRRTISNSGNIGSSLPGAWAPA